MQYITLGALIALLVLVLFFLLSERTLMSSELSSVFECGFSSYYFSRFSFSMHYFTIGLIFLFLDLELCYIMPLFNLSFSEIKNLSYLWIFIMVLLIGLLEEWKFNLLEWKS